MISYRYGNVFLQLARTVELSFVQERDPFGVDSMYTVYTIRIKGFLSQSEGQFPGVNQTAITAETLNRIKAELETPRLPMEYRIAGQTIVSVPSGSIDAKIGPEPLPCRITEVNTGTFMVECGCIVRVVDCTETCPGGRSPILSLRWTQTETFDENWFSNLVTDGHLIVRSDLLQSADNFRPLATPPILSDYIRTVSRYTLSPDGLILTFHFEDVEKDRLPPYPCTKITGTYTVETPQPGFNRFGHVHLKLEGQKGTSRKALLILGCAMAYSKLRADQLLSVPAVIMWGNFTEDLFDPVVDVNVFARMTPIMKDGFAVEKVFGGAVAGLAGGAGAPVAIGGGADAEASKFAALVMPSVGQETTGLKSGQPGIAPPDRKRLRALLTAMFRDPCLCLETEVELRTNTAPPSNERNSEIVSTEELRTNPSPFDHSISTGAGTSSIVEIGITAVTGGLLNSVGLLRDAAPYDTYQIETTTTMETGNLQMPGTGVGTDGGISEVVTGHGGMMQLITSWVAGRTGKPPQLPTFESPDPNVVPLYGSIVAKDAVPNPDGTSLVYMIAGYYVHAIKNPKLHQIASAVGPMYDAEVKTGAAEAASFWTDTALWATSNGVVGGLLVSKNAAPLVPDGVDTTPQPQVPPGFDLSNLTSQQLNSIIQTGSPNGTALPNGGFDLSNLTSQELLNIIQTGSANPGGQTPTPDYFYSPPRNP